MSVTALQVGNIRIDFTKDFEQQGFAVTDVTGLAEYGEHLLGYPGSCDIVIEGVILPGNDPYQIRSNIFSSANPHEPLKITAELKSGTNLTSTGYVSSIKCKTHNNPSEITVTISRKTGWYGEMIPAILTKDKSTDTLKGIFEFDAQMTIDTIFLVDFPHSVLEGGKYKITITHSILSTHADQEINTEQREMEVPLNSLINALNITENNGVVLPRGSILRIYTGLNHKSVLFVDGREYDIPALGRINNMTVPPSYNPTITFYTEDVNLLTNYQLHIFVQARETLLTI